MFERFTDRARAVVVAAQEEARHLGHAHIGTEHLLLGLIAARDTIAAQTLNAAGLFLDEVRDDVMARVAAAPDAPAEHLGFTPRAKHVLELALRESMRLEAADIGPEHILLGILGEGEGVAAVLLLANVDGGLERIEADLIGRMNEREPGGRRERMKRRAAQAVAAHVVASPANDDVLERLAAIEARLTMIEEVLREQGSHPPI